MPSRSNTGKKNSFAGVNVKDLSGGVFNIQDLAKNNAFACLAFEAATQAEPDVVIGAVAELGASLTKILGDLACPKLDKIDMNQLKQFPGYAKSQ